MVATAACIPLFSILLTSRRPFDPPQFKRAPIHSYMILFLFQTGLVHAFYKQGSMNDSSLLDESSDDSSLSRIIELSATGNGVLEERTLVVIPRIACCRMIRLASELVVSDNTGDEEA